MLVNGAAALRTVTALEPARLALSEERYPSLSRPAKELWHEASHFLTAPRPVPMIGFPFLRNPRTHNSYVEIDQLAARARAHVLG